MPEVILAQGKTPEQVAQIAARLLEQSRNVLATRADQRTADLVKAHCADAEYFPLSGAIRVWRDRTIHGKGKIAVVCAGTSDIFVAEEAQVTAEAMGNQVEAIFDAGVAGIHRRMNNRDRLLEARVVGGLVWAPVIAVPASVATGTVSTAWRRCRACSTVAPAT